MARNKAKFRYYRIGIPLDSELPDLLDQDAKSCGMSAEIAKLVVVRLSDYYKGISTKSVLPPVQEVVENVEAVDEMELKRKNALASAGEWE